METSAELCNVRSKKQTAVIHAMPLSAALSRNAADFLIAEAKSWYPRETGGVLVGQSVGGRLIVERAVGPGPNATHERAFFQRDQEYSEQQVEELYRQSDGRIDYLGEWHSHSRRQGPSRTDIGSMLQINKDASNNCPFPLLIIVMQHRRRWTFIAYFPSESELSQISMEIEE